MKSVWIGIDNGVTGTIGVITDDKAAIYPMPTFEQYNYTKVKQKIKRIDVKKLKELLLNYIGDNPERVIVGIERPMVNPARFKATTSALRALEATLIVLEELCLPYVFIDSKQWQKVLLPKKLKGSSELKKASLQVAAQLYPKLRSMLLDCPDGDGLLIAEYCKREFK